MSRLQSPFHPNLQGRIKPPAIAEHVHSERCPLSNDREYLEPLMDKYWLYDVVMWEIFNAHWEALFDGKYDKNGYDRLWFTREGIRPIGSTQTATHAAKVGVDFQLKRVLSPSTADFSIPAMVAVPHKPWGGTASHERFSIDTDLNSGGVELSTPNFLTRVWEALKRRLE